MFNDYYALLEIEQNSSKAEIKKAFRRQAIKWHPDRNPTQDTTSRMQDLNEAYLILKDDEARRRYDIEYNRFKNYTKPHSQKRPPQASQTVDGQRNHHTGRNHEATKYSYDYEVVDDLLKRWINNAKRQAIDLAKSTIEDFKGVTIAASKGCFSSFGSAILWIVFVNIVYLLFQAC